MISKSPDRNSFQKTNYVQRMAEQGRTPENDANVQAMMEFYSNAKNVKAEREADPEWRKNNLEYDLRSSDWILKKVRDSESYAQNLYAAMCNRSFIRNDVWPILKNQEWSCSWRYAGGIIADMREQGDYIDWYCSGIRGEVNDEEFGQMTKEEQENYLLMKNTFVGEGHVTEEIREDLLRLGWLVVDDENSN